MAYDEALADRIRDLLGSHPDDPEVTERKMFGGLAFLVSGHMTVAAVGRGGLMVRVDPQRAEEYVDGVDVDRVVMRGRPMNGWLEVGAPALATDEQLRRWVETGMAFVRTLPPK